MSLGDPTCKKCRRLSYTLDARGCCQGRERERCREISSRDADVEWSSVDELTASSYQRRMERSTSTAVNKGPKS